ncbi:MAG TPA: TetR/AcrR family transcriptional regulator [Blastocatellia bacterium]|nr:TetR/AcrR family transcriptional regulator [Blastocatellia bacterium]
MRYSAEHKKETRDRILRAASRQVRARGAKGVAIADLMGKLEMTHGGFYRHFGSKEQLLVEAVVKGFEEVAAKQTWALAKARPGRELRNIIELYLSPEHCANPANGCPLAALTSEIARYPRGLRGKIDRALRKHLKPIARFLPGENEAERERNCLILFSGMAGALNLARGMVDQESRDTLLEAAREFYVNAFCA